MVHVPPGRTLTFGRGGPGLDVDIELADRGVSRLAGELTAAEDYWLITNLSTEVSLVVDNPEGGGEYITVAPRRIAAPVPFEFARVSLPTRERPVEFLVFAPQHAYAEPGAAIGQSRRSRSTRPPSTWTVSRIRSIATSSIRASCVRRFGLALPARESRRHLPSRQDRYGLADEHTARTWAYSMDRPPSTVTPWEMKVRWSSRLFAIVNGADSSGRRARIAGLPEGGCRAQANRTLERGSALRAQNPVPALERHEDPVDAPASHWTTVRMRANPRPTPRQRRHGVRPSAGEKRAAVTDVRCKQRSRLVERWAAAEVAAQQKLIAAHLDTLRRYREGLDRIVANAERI